MGVKALTNDQAKKANKHPSSIQTTRITMPGKEGFSLQFVVRFVKRIRQFESAVRIRKMGILADGKNTMEILILETTWKSTLYFECEGSDARQAIKCINIFFIRNGGMN